MRNFFATISILIICSFIISCSTSNLSVGTIKVRHESVQTVKATAGLGKDYADEASKPILYPIHTSPETHLNNTITAEDRIIGNLPKSQSISSTFHPKLNQLPSRQPQLKNIRTQLQISYGIVPSPEEQAKMYHKVAIIGIWFAGVTLLLLLLSIVAGFPIILVVLWLLAAITAGVLGSIAVIHEDMLGLIGMCIGLGLILIGVYVLIFAALNYLANSND